MVFVKLIKRIALLVYLLPVYVNAGTVGLLGSWDFDGYLSPIAPSVGLPNPVTGTFDFDSGELALNGSDVFFGTTWTITDGLVLDNGDGTYNGVLTFAWGASFVDINYIWDITLQPGGDSAQLLTVSTDGDSALIGILTSVPIPAAVWLFGSGLIGLLSIAKRSSGKHKA